MLLIDSAVLIASAREKDPQHQRATELLRAMLQSSETLILTDHILDETLTYLKRKEGKKVAYQTGMYLFQEPNVRIEYSSPERSNAALLLLGKIDSISFCDALSIVIMQELGIKKICSFDADFDKIEGMERIE